MRRQRGQVELAEGATTAGQKHNKHLVCPGQLRSQNAPTSLWGPDWRVRIGAPVRLSPPSGGAALPSPLPVIRPYSLSFEPAMLPFWACRETRRSGNTDCGLADDRSASQTPPPLSNRITNPSPACCFFFCCCFHPIHGTRGKQPAPLSQPQHPRARVQTARGHRQLARTGCSAKEMRHG